jgi:predicted RNase H-like HicB family nuclease
LLDTVEFSLNLACTVKREDDDIWVAGCPALDVYSQGDTQEDAKRSLEEAISLWAEDCHERGTLDQALRELGFIKVHPGEVLNPNAEHIMVTPENGDTFPLSVSIPAYQAAAFLSAHS